MKAGRVALQVAFEGVDGERGTKRQQGWQIAHEHSVGTQDSGTSPSLQTCRLGQRTTGYTPDHTALPWCVGRETLPDGPGQEGLMEKVPEPVGLCSCSPCCTYLVWGQRVSPAFFHSVGGSAALHLEPFSVLRGFQTTG